MKTSFSKLLYHITESDFWKFISKFSSGGPAGRVRYEGFACVLLGGIQPHSDSVYGSRGVPYFRSKLHCAARLLSVA